MKPIVMRPILWMVGITIFGFLLMLLLLGTRRGERRTKLSTKDLGTLTEIETEPTVLRTSITNVRTLYVVVEEDDTDKNKLAQRYCELVQKNDALVELVRIVKIDQSSELSEGKPT